jgi:hypothetical protein
MDGDALGHKANPGRVDEDFVGLAAVHDLRITSHQLHARFIGGRAHGLHDAPEIFHRRPFLEDETDRQVEWARAAHREIVDRPVHGQFPNVAAREKIGLTT